MSHLHDGTAHPRAEDDHVDSRTVVLVGVGALFTFTVAALVALAYLRHEILVRPAPALPPELGRTKIGLVEQSPFFDGGALRGEKDRAARLARLNGWGWVDRAAGVAHIPIEEAMKLVAAGARAPRAEPPVAPPLGALRGGADAPSVPLAPPFLAAPDQALPRAPAYAPAGKGGTR
jgi:hypothetical protein